MKIKKLMSVFLAILVVATCSVTAFASDGAALLPSDEYTASGDVGISPMANPFCSHSQFKVTTGSVTETCYGGYAPGQGKHVKSWMAYDCKGTLCDYGWIDYEYHCGWCS